MTQAELLAAVEAEIDRLTPELVSFRRDLHRHPELSWQEKRSTAQVVARLEQAGLAPKALPQGGVVADVNDQERFVALRADLDALPVEDRTGDPWASEVPGVAHACGHDVHTTALLGAGLALAAIAPDLAGQVRLLFQPAEEVMPGGALATMGAGVLDGASRIFSVHCDPTIDVGQVGLREGPLTGAADFLTVELSGSGGHTSRPHLTEDLTFALGKLVTELPAVLTRRFDPRAGVSVVWGVVQAGSAANVIPSSGRASGTVRMLDAVAWADAERLVTETVAQVLAPYGVAGDVAYVRGVPPVVNDARAIAELSAAVATTIGPNAQVSTTQSLGGEDFAWYLDRVPGAMARLGTRTPGGPTYDLHQGDLRVDEGAVAVGAKVLAGAAITALSAH
ncbi:MAG TPA: amidohydrolase [Marmoricola sp.]